VESRGRKVRCEAELAEVVEMLPWRDRERVWRAGFEGGFAGVERHMGPYRDGTVWDRVWGEGWWRGRKRLVGSEDVT
jgi:ribosome modulation factor